MGITAISVTPSEPEAIPPIASMTAMERGWAEMEYQPDKPKNAGKKVALYSRAGSSLALIDPRSKAHKNVKLMTRCQTVWDLARKHVEKTDEYATEIAVRATPNPNSPHKDEICISYKNKAGDVKCIYAKDMPGEIVEKMEKIRTLVRPSRTLDPQPPLQISQPSLLRKESCSKFLDAHFKELEAGLKGEAKTNALRNIITTEAFIQGFQMHLGGLIQGQEEELKRTLELPHPAHKKKKDELEKLKKLQQELQNIDRNAVFRAVASWGNLQTGAIDDHTRTRLQETANQVSLDTQRDLQKQETARQETHRIRNSAVGRKFGLFTPMEGPEIRGYALDVGDLLLQDPQDVQHRRAETERNNKPCCVEQLVVHQMMNLLNPSIQVDPSHPVLAEFDEDTRQNLMGLIEAPLPEKGKDQQYYPKAYARAVHERLSSSFRYTTNLDSRLAILRANSSTLYRFPDLIK